MGYLFDAIRQSSRGPDGPDPLAAKFFGDDEGDAQRNESESESESESKSESESGVGVGVDAESEAAERPIVDPPGMTVAAVPEAPAAEATDGAEGAFRAVKMNPEERLVVASAPESVHAEAYRRLASRMLAAHGKTPLATAITSAARQDGKTITSTNLAMVMSELPDRRTILVDGDLRVAYVEKLLRTRRNAPGLHQLLKGEAALEEAIVQIEGTNLCVMFAGCRGEPDQPHLLRSQRLPEIIAQLRSRFDHVVVDTPPILDVADAGALCAAADQVTLAVRMNRTPRHLVHEAKNAVQGYNAPLAGLVLTDVKPHAAPYGQHYEYRYRYGYAYGRRA